jgi:type IV pilus assembly protein PilM
MSRLKQLIINCGASQVTAAIVSSEGPSLKIERLVSKDLVYDPTDDDAWLVSVGDALRSLGHEHKFSGKATLIIPGNQVLTKSIRIAHVEASRRAQVIAFEAQQNIPYPMHEIVWDSQEVSDDGVEIEVLFIACKSDTIDQFTRIVAGTGIQVDAISAATVLDYNALRFASAESDEDVLLVNIGARSTNLLFKNADAFFVRNITLGGNLLTQSIADRVGQSFGQAEAIKRKFFAGATDSSVEDSGSKQLIECAESFTRRMSQEITRSIVNYRRQTKGAAPKRILLAGHGSLLRGLSEQLAASQKVQVEFFDPLVHVELGGEISVTGPELKLQVSEIIGEASRPLILNAAGVNLLPEEIQQALVFTSKKPFLLLAAVCIALAPWPALIGFRGLSSGVESIAATKQAELAPLQARAAEITENSERAMQLGESIKRVEGLVNSKSNWIQFLAELQQGLTVAEDVWLDELNVLREQPTTGEPSYNVVLHGKMLVRDSVGAVGVNEAVLSSRIKSLQSSIEGSEFVVSSMPPVITWTSLRSGLNVLPFRIKLVVDTAKPL